MERRKWEVEKARLQACRVEKREPGDARAKEERERGGVRVKEAGARTKEAKEKCEARAAEWKEMWEKERSWGTWEKWNLEWQAVAQSSRATAELYHYNQTIYK